MSIKHFIGQSWALQVFGFFVVLLLATASFLFFAHTALGQSVFQDFDNDGLSNSEEVAFGTDPHNADTDGDGFRDGVEVESGYDPLKSAPGDRIVPDRQKVQPLKDREIIVAQDNLTQKMTADLVTRLGDYEEAGKGGLNVDEFSETVDTIVEENITFSALGAVDPARMTIKETDYSTLSAEERAQQESADVAAYISALAYVITSHLPGEEIGSANVDDLMASVVVASSAMYTGSIDNFIQEDHVTFLEGIADGLFAAQAQIEEITVPASMVDIHTRALALTDYAGTLYNEKNYKKEDDALAVIADLSQFEKLLTEATTLLDDIDAQLETFNITAEALQQF